jgi:glycosyltransferase involved in cell wall biosynthesis
MPKQEEHKERDYSFTVITVSYNNASTIRQTIESVLSQTWKKLEYWVIDGGSDDGTIDILREFGNSIRWISEPDKGLYHAMNKGWNRAEMEYIGFLNADDFFAHDKVIAEMVSALKRQPDSWTIYGDLAYVKAENPASIVRYWKAGNYSRSSFRFGWMPPHPTFYVRKEAFELFQGFMADDLKSAADYEFILRLLFKNRLSSVYSPGIKVKMRTGGISNRNLQNRIRGNREDALAWELNGLKPYFFTLWLKPIRKIMQYIRRP